MKKWILVLSLLSIQAWAADEAKISPPTQPPPPPKVTVKEAKKACKDEGKEGVELLKCIKEKKGTE